MNCYEEKLKEHIRVNFDIYLRTESMKGIGYCAYLIYGAIKAKEGEIGPTVKLDGNTKVDKFEFPDEIDYNRAIKTYDIYLKNRKKFSLEKVASFFNDAGFNDLAKKVKQHIESNK